MSEMTGVPANLVLSMLQRGEEVAKTAAARAKEHASSRQRLRDALTDTTNPSNNVGLYRVCENDIHSVDPPIMSAVDGAMVVDSKGIGDLCTAVAIALGPTEETSESLVFMEQINRSVSNKELTTGIMASLEVEVASRAFGDVVLMDGAFISTLISISKALFSAQSLDGRSNHLADRVHQIKSDDFRNMVLEILSGQRHIAVPKYVTRNDFEAFVPHPYKELDARSIATLALLPGEATQFLKTTRSSYNDADRNLIGNALGFSTEEKKYFAHLLEGIHSCFYRPHPWTPAFSH